MDLRNTFTLVLLTRNLMRCLFIGPLQPSHSNVISLSAICFCTMWSNMQFRVCFLQIYLLVRKRIFLVVVAKIDRLQEVWQDGGGAEYKWWNDSRLSVTCICFHHPFLTIGCFAFLGMQNGFRLRCVEACPLLCRTTHFRHATDLMVLHLSYHYHTLIIVSTNKDLNFCPLPFSLNFMLSRQAYVISLSESSQDLMKPSYSSQLGLSCSSSSSLLFFLSILVVLKSLRCAAIFFLTSKETFWHCPICPLWWA